MPSRTKPKPDLPASTAKHEYGRYRVAAPVAHVIGNDGIAALTTEGTSC
jgi:hypothetical protein